MILENRCDNIDKDFEFFEDPEKVELFCLNIILNLRLCF